MATVLSFEAALRRTPAYARRAVSALTAPVRPTPLPRRAMRAVGSAAIGATPVISEAALARRFFTAALLVAVVDLLAKAFAAAVLPLGELFGRGPVALMLAYNTGTAGGMSLGVHTRAINLASTGVIVGLLVMLVPTLARIDRRSTMRMALVVGGGLGNLASLATSSHGVVDFIVLRAGSNAIVVNVADLAMWLGLALLAGTGLELVRQMRARGAGAPVRI
jgi:lipoprotein signal peptidase